MTEPGTAALVVETGEMSAPIDEGLKPPTPGVKPLDPSAESEQKRAKRSTISTVRNSGPSDERARRPLICCFVDLRQRYLWHSSTRRKDG